jgi:hypothetical protein
MSSCACLVGKVASQADKRHDERVPCNGDPPDRAAPAAEIVRPVPVVRVVLVHAATQNGENVRDLAGERAAGEKRLEGGLRANRDRAERGRDDEHRERCVVRRLRPRADLTQPYVTRKRLVTTVRKEDARGGDEL